MQLQNKQLEWSINKIEIEKKKMAADIIDIWAYPMRKNLFFYNIPEQEDENPIALGKNFVQRKLHIESANREF